MVSPTLPPPCPPRLPAAVFMSSGFGVPLFATLPLDRQARPSPAQVPPKSAMLRQPTTAFPGREILGTVRDAEVRDGGGLPRLFPPATKGG